MGQFDGYIERNAPPSPRTARVYSLVMPIAVIGYVVVTRDLRLVPIAVFLTLMFLPAGIAPRACERASAALDRHAVPSILFGFSFTGGGAFALLSTVVSYSTSLYVAAPVAVVLTTYSAIRRQARLRASS